MITCSQPYKTLLFTPIGEYKMKKLLTLTLMTIISFAIAGCNKTSKVNASATSATASSCSASADACCGSEACGTDAKAMPAAAGTNDSCCSSMKKMEKMTKTKPAAAGTTSGACDPSDCADMKMTCPMSGRK